MKPRLFTASTTLADTDLIAYIKDLGSSTWGERQIPVSNFKTEIGTLKVNKAGDTMTGALVLPGDPVSDLQAATKAYVDAKAFAAAAGLDWKESCRAATTADITLSGAQTIDGVSVIAGDRVLVKNQSTGSQNGIYVAASGAWARATDADANAEVTAGLFTVIEEGTTLADTGWYLTTNAPITVGSTTLTFAQFKPALNDGEVTYAKMQNISATQRALGRNTAGAGVAEEVTASQLLDWIGSTRGSLLFRGASGWAGVVPGTSGHVLTSNGSGADPTYQAAGAGLSATGSAYAIVGGSAVATTNGTDLLAAYTAAKTATPHGAALSASNRFTIFLLPGVYDLGSSALTLDTQFIDVVGLSSNTGQRDLGAAPSTDMGDTVIKSSQTTCNISINANTHNIALVNLCLYTSDGSQTYSALTTAYSSFGTDLKVYNCLIVGESANTHTMPWDKSMDGMWVDTRCYATCAFGKAVSSTLTAPGTFIRCIMGPNSMAGGEGGTAITVSGTLIDCWTTGATQSVGKSGDTISGRIIRLNAASSGGILGGTINSSAVIEFCNAGSGSSYGSGTVMAGVLVGCSGSTIGFTSVTGRVVGCDFPGGMWSKQLVLLQKTLTYGATTDIDFAGHAYQILPLTGNVTLTFSNLAADRSVTLEIQCDGTGRTIAYPAGVRVVGTALPTSIAANKIIIVTFRSNATTAADVRAACAVEA